MAKALTADGKCPDCKSQIVKPHSIDKSRTFYAVKSMIVNAVDGVVDARCARCKTELTMPVLKIPAKIRKRTHAN